MHIRDPGLQKQEKRTFCNLTHYTTVLHIGCALILCHKATAKTAKGKGQVNTCWVKIRVVDLGTLQTIVSKVKS